MPFSLAQYAAVSFVLFFSSVVQGAVGFAAGLFGIPLLMLSGVSFPDAVAISLVAAAPQNIIPAWQLRHEIDYRRALRPMLIRYALLPVGVCMLWLVGHGSKDVASQIVGVIVLLIVTVQRAWPCRRKSDCTRPGNGWRLDWAAFCWASAAWEVRHGPVGAGARLVDESRGHFCFISLRRDLFRRPCSCGCFLEPKWSMPMLLSAAALPVVLVGLWCGLVLSRRIPDQLLKRASVVVLMLIAVGAIGTPYLRATGAEATPTRSTRLRHSECSSGDSERSAPNAAARRKVGRRLDMDVEHDPIPKSFEADVIFACKGGNRRGSILAELPGSKASALTTASALGW